MPVVQRSGVKVHQDRTYQSRRASSVQPPRTKQYPIPRLTVLSAIEAECNLFLPIHAPRISPSALRTAATIGRPTHTPAARH